MKAPLLGPDYHAPEGPFPIPTTERGLAARREILELVRSGAYGLEAVPCLCGGTQEEVVATVDRYRIPHRTVMCRDCGLVRTNPRWNGSAYGDFYARFYRAIYERPGHSAQGMYAHQRGNAERRAAFIAPHLTPGRKHTVLELGCGSGWNLLPLRERGHDVAGYDFDEEYLATGRAHGLDLRRGGIAEALADGRRHDVVILSHVVEHFLDPVGDLSQVRGLLAHGGRLFVEVPNLFAVTRNLLRYWQGAHTYSFVPATLRALMQRAGYEEIALDDAIASLWQVRSAPPAAIAWPNVAAETRRFLASRDTDTAPKLIARAIGRRLRRLGRACLGR
ncbi:MAG: class I SAM-dependent methyltransferase [Opitutaceae bacterium]|nr:class I SAM-dependent methyltransferase [Opitutaceae bacterium]